MKLIFCISVYWIPRNFVVVHVLFMHLTSRKTLSMANNRNMNSPPGSNAVNQENPNGNEVSSNINDDNVVVSTASNGDPRKILWLSTR